METFGLTFGERYGILSTEFDKDSRRQRWKRRKDRDNGRDDFTDGPVGRDKGPRRKTPGASGREERGGFHGGRPDLLADE